MPDLGDRFRALDRVRTPDLWPGIQLREPSPSDRDRGKPGGVAALVSFIVAVSLVAAVVWVVGRPGGGGTTIPLGSPSLETPPPAEASGPPVTTSAEIELADIQLEGKGRVECTALFPHSVVEPGRKTGVDFTLTNLSPHPVQIPLGNHGLAGSLEFRRPDDTLIIGTQQMQEGLYGPAPRLETVGPDATRRIGTWDWPVIWDGALVVTPSCNGYALPPVTLHVASPGRLADAQASLDAALQDEGDTFGRCRPEPGQSVVGVVSRRGAEYPVRCEAAVLARDGFDVVVLAIVSPADGSTVDLAELATEIRVVPFLDLNGSVAVSWWVYVASQQGATEVHQMSVALRCDGSSLSSGPGVQFCLRPTVE